MCKYKLRRETRTHQKKSPLEITIFCSLYTIQKYFEIGKVSARGGDVDETFCSEISRGGYGTEYDKVVLPNYLVYLPSQNDVIMDISVDEELNERENGWD